MKKLKFSKSTNPKGEKSQPFKMKFCKELFIYNRSRKKHAKMMLKQFSRIIWLKKKTKQTQTIFNEKFRFYFKWTCSGKLLEPTLFPSVIVSFLGSLLKQKEVYIAFHNSTVNAKLRGKNCCMMLGNPALQSNAKH